MKRLNQSSQKKISSMKEGGKSLALIKKKLREFVKPGVSFEEIESLAQKLIKEANCQPSFSTVSGYKWATCVMKNDQLCHGIPINQKVENGDLITIDVGLINRGYHLDTTMSLVVGQTSQSVQKFLSVGKLALQKAIDQAQVGSSVFQISRAMQKTVQKAGYGVVYQLTGHGVGEELHMDPSIPCVAQRADKRILLEENQTVAIEVMYTAGNPDLKLSSDGWTYITQDGSLSAMFEETVLITKDGPLVLTAE